jgi:ElaB/YqjD/DUF883 family membrane-anchored ribosome-binding protein
MKDVFAILGVIFLAGLLMVAVSDGKKTDDQAVKDKINIIALAENSDDPVVKSQGEIAKAELNDLQAAKQQAVLEEQRAEAEKIKEEARSKAAKAELQASPTGRFLNIFQYVVIGILGVGFATIFFVRMSRPSRY